jgi:galactosamine-6-phosphate isomerase
MLRTKLFIDHEALSLYAADWLADFLARKPDSLLCLAAGNTPMRAYELLARQKAVRSDCFDQLRVIKLDEWGGLDMDDPASCEHYLRRVLVDPLALADRYVGFNSRAPDPNAECRRVEAWLVANGPIDVSVLGLGINGHIGFNEPDSSLLPHAHVAKLSVESIRHPMLTGANNRPTYGLTLGMADLLHSRHVLLMVSGQKKRQPLKRLLDGPIGTEFPASLLALHSNVVVLCDHEAQGSHH